MVPRPLLIGLLVALFAWLAWRIFRQPGKRSKDAAGAKAVPSVSGADSEFYRIEALLAARSLGREPSEPLSAWISRLARAGVAADSVEELRAIVRLHYRLRFDPLPMAAPDRDELRARVERWLRGEEASAPAVR